MKRLTLIFIVSLLISLLFVNCKKSEKSPAEDVTKKSGEVEKSSDTQDMLLTEKEVQNFIKAFPIFKTEAEKLGEKFKGGDKNILQAMRTGKEAAGAMKKLNNVLKPYGLTTESFFETYGKVAASYGMLAMGGPNKYYDQMIQSSKASLNVPNIDKETKKEIEQNIKDLEEQRNSEDTKAIAKNCTILEKYKDEIEGIFNSD